LITDVRERYDLVRACVHRTLNPTAFGFQAHFDITASLRRPAAGVVVTFRF
jgi:hypothetical protein